MAYLPTYCTRCDRVGLHQSEAREPRTTCAVCGKGTTVVPDARYALADVPLFFRIEAALEAAALTDVESYRILCDIDGVPSDAVASEAAFERAALECVELADVRTSLRDDAVRAIRALGMLTTILRARAAGKRLASRESGLSFTAAGTLRALSQNRIGRRA